MDRHDRYAFYSKQPSNTESRIWDRCIDSDFDDKRCTRGVSPEPSSAVRYRILPPEASIVQVLDHVLMF
jgi:hypothetical protein